MINALKNIFKGRTAEQEIIGNRALSGAFLCLVSFIIAYDIFITYIFALYSIINSLLYWIQNKNISNYRIRIFFTLIFDAFFGYALLIRDAEAMSFIYPLFLWATLGVGFRLGIPWLFLAAGFSTITFGIAVATTIYWQNNVILGYALTTGLFLLPAYWRYCTTVIGDPL